MYHEICTAVQPSASLSRTLEQWNDIARMLADSKRTRVRQKLSIIRDA